jgi:hypothetical protein
MHIAVAKQGILTKLHLLHVEFGPTSQVHIVV